MVARRLQYAPGVLGRVREARIRSARDFFRPTYFDVLKFHEIDSGEVGEEDVQMYERTGAEIALDYREVMSKLRDVEVSPYEKSQDLPDDWEAIEQLMRIIEQDT